MVRGTKRYRGWALGRKVGSENRQGREAEAAETDGKNPRDLGSALGIGINLSGTLGRPLNFPGHQFCHMNFRRLMEVTSKNFQPLLCKTANKRGPVCYAGKRRIKPTVFSRCSFIHSPPHDP